MAYIGSSPTKVVSRQSANIFTYTATANQTAFTGSDANGNTLACTPSDIMVHMNGIKLEESDYTASTTTVTLGSGAAAGDEVTITAFVTFETADAYTKSASDTRYVNATGDTMTGSLKVGSATSSRALATKSNTSVTIANFESTSSVGGLVSFSDANTTDDVHVRVGAVANNLVLQAGGSERVRVDSSGRVTTPNQPSFAVHSVPGNFATGQVLNWQTVEYDRGSNFNNSNNRFTAPVAGFYHFSLIVFTNRTTSTGDVYWDLRKNGSNIWRNYIGKDGGSNVHVQAQGSTQVYLAANDYIDVYYTASLNTMDNSALHNRFSGYLIG